MRPRTLAPNWVAARPAIAGLLLALISSGKCFAIEPVQAELDRPTAWTGEPVGLIITLHSPGPFSGTAAFDIPRLPRTSIVSMGNPVVGSEVIEGTTFITQRHEFSIYSQQIGEVVVPPFRVRFSAKENFVGEPQEVDGRTPELRFQSQRPPTTGGDAVILAVAAMDVQQTWNPDPKAATLCAGDVLERTIVQRATGTSAMMLSPIAAEAPPAVRVYASAPLVEDRNERGDVLAVRRDTLKYQFERPGNYELPALDISWWDTQKNQLQRVQLAAATIEVAATSAPEVTGRRAGVWTIAGLAAVTLALLAGSAVLRWRVARPVGSERSEARAVVRACRTHNDALAYRALLVWSRRMGQLPTAEVAGNIEHATFRREWERLSLRLFGRQQDTSTWSGTKLAASFLRLRRMCLTNHANAQGAALPPLNPDSRSHAAASR